MGFSNTNTAGPQSRGQLPFSARAVLKVALDPSLHAAAPLGLGGWMAAPAFQEFSGLPRSCRWALGRIPWERARTTSIPKLVLRHQVDLGDKKVTRTSIPLARLSKYGDGKLLSQDGLGCPLGMGASLS